MEQELTGWFNYKGNTTQQHEGVVDVFKSLFLAKKPSRIIEIGTAYGGLTMILRDILNDLGMQNVPIRTYDNYHKHYLDEIEGIDARIHNLFDNSYLKLDEEESKECTDFIMEEGVTILLCDGGSKVNEFKLLSPFLKSGDIIMAHDYSPNREYFEQHVKGKIWNWLEIQDSDIEEAVVANNLKPYMAEDFNKVVWVCKERE